jgi:hypothetical protein
MAKRAQIEEVRPLLNDLDKAATAAEHVVDVVETGVDKAATAVEHGLEKAADVVPEVLDKSVHVIGEGGRHVARGIRNPKTAAIVLVVGGVVIGAGVGVGGYFIMKKRLTKQFEERLDREIEEMRTFFQMRNKDGAYSTPEAAAEALQVTDILEDYRGEASTERPPTGDDPREGTNQKVAYHKIRPTVAPPSINTDVTVPLVAATPVETTTVETEDGPVEVVRNVFTDVRVIEGWDQEAEEAARDENHPYIISHDEFMENSFQHDQNSITWYAGDETLADERDAMVEDVARLVGGVENLRFGHGSRDSKIVYIRNEALEMDLEIAQSMGEYSKEVMGLGE